MFFFLIHFKKVHLKLTLKQRIILWLAKVFLEPYENSVIFSKILQRKATLGKFFQNSKFFYKRDDKPNHILMSLEFPKENFHEKHSNWKIVPWTSCVARCNRTLRSQSRAAM